VRQQRTAPFFARSDSKKVAFFFVTFFLAKQKESKVTRARTTGLTHIYEIGSEGNTSFYLRKKFGNLG